jgi:hypothetical protein
MMMITSSLSHKREKKLCGREVAKYIGQICDSSDKSGCDMTSRDFETEKARLLYMAADIKAFTLLGQGRVYMQPNKSVL